jgi:ComF family protein
MLAPAKPSLMRALLQLVAPASCAACDVPLVGDEEGFCGGCALLVDALPPHQRPPREAAAAYAYGGPLGEAICRLKYAGRTDLAGMLGRKLCDACDPYAGDVDVVMPLPLHPARLRERGFNQAALLARPVARMLGVALDARSLVRIRPTAVQASLPRPRRLDNVRGAFAARVPPRPTRVLLIDDVRTTGATLASAADALLAVGYPRVFTLALARAEA